MKKALQVMLFLFIGTFLANAQERPNPNQPQGTNLEVPEGWEVRLDRPSEDVVIGSKSDSSDIYFVNMTPGWHISTGPAAIFYHPANTAEGTFTIQSELHLFDPGERNREAFGLFWGGQNLADDNQEYYYFLIRNTGEFLIKKRTGDETELIQNWTASEALVIYDDPEESSVLNKLAVSVNEDSISFLINDQQVASISNEGMDNTGIFGLRVNHSINLHVSDLSLME